MVLMVQKAVSIVPQIGKVLILGNIFFCGIICYVNHSVVCQNNIERRISSENQKSMD